MSKIILDEGENLIIQYNPSSAGPVEVQKTNVGDLIIDEVSNSLITHRKQFPFMTVSDTFESGSSDIALSLKGAQDLAAFTSDNEIMEGVTTVKEALNRLIEIVNYSAPVALSNKYMTFSVTPQTFYKGIETEFTFTGSITKVPYYIDSIKFGTDSKMIEQLQYGTKLVAGNTFNF